MGKKDIIIKEYMRDKARFADAFNYYLYNGKNIINASDLIVQDTTELGVILGEFGVITKERIRDILKEASVMSDNDYVYLILGIENQSDVHYAMPVKTMICDALNYVSQVQTIAKNHREKQEMGSNSGEFLSGFFKEDKLKPIITMTIYWGTEEWDGPRSLFDMFPEMDLETMSGINNYKVLLLTPRDIDNYSIFQTELGIVFKFLALAGDKSLLNTIRKDMEFRDVSLETVQLMEVCAGLKIKKVLTEKGGVNMCKAWEELKAEYRIEGLTEGRAEGKIEGENRFASLTNQLLKEGLIDMIQRVIEDISLRELYYEKYGIK